MSLFTLRQNAEHKKGWLSPDRDIYHTFAEGESELAAKIISYEFYDEIEKKDSEKYLKKLGWTIQESSKSVFTKPDMPCLSFTTISGGGGNSGLKNKFKKFFSFFPAWFRNK